jgi:hypothetical protein
MPGPTGLSNPLSGGLDSAKTAGVLVIGAVCLLAAIRKGFGSVRIGIGD